MIDMTRSVNFDKFFDNEVLDIGLQAGLDVNVCSKTFDTFG